MSSARLDYSDPEEVRRTMEALRSALDDIDAIVWDMLAPPRARQLGPAEHRRLYRQAHRKAKAIVRFMQPRDDRADPAGSGGSPGH